MANKVMKITAADFERVVSDVVNQRMQIAGGREPNEEDAPYRPGPGDGKPPWPGYPKPYEPKLAKGPVLPEFKPMGREIKGVREGVLPLKDTKIKQQLQIGPQAGASSRQIRDRLKPFTRGGPADYDKEGGSLRDIPASLRPILLRDAMAENKLSTPYWDKQKKIQDYLKNDERLRERGLLGGTKKA